MKAPALGLFLALACLVAGCAAPEYPVRDDHDHTPGPALMPLPAHQSETEGG